ncbi:hypothetical protein VZT92_022138 [Zoarces viviparus]|uniref:Uncharacterized protein n=1 Tax=Zoarces viviparus TaxID=48416 RepID=A0AAW1EAJ3_ZOAVI
MPEALPYLNIPPPPFDLSTTSTGLNISNLILPSSTAPSHPFSHSLYRSLSALGKSPGCVRLVRPPSGLTVGEPRGATKRDTCQLSRQTKQVLWQRLEEGQLSIRPAAHKHRLHHIWPRDQSLTE